MGLEKFTFHTSVNFDLGGLLLLFSQALGAVEAMSDRYCVSFQEKVHISAENLMTCCEFCGHG